MKDRLPLNALLGDLGAAVDGDDPGGGVLTSNVVAD